MSDVARLRQVGEDEEVPDNLIGLGDEQSPESPSPAATKAATQALLMALTALSKRTLIAISATFTLVSVGLVCWVWMTIIQEPNAYKLIAGSVFSIFALVSDWIRRTKHA